MRKSLMAKRYKKREFSINSNLFVIIAALYFGCILNYPVVSKIITLAFAHGQGYFAFSAPLLLSAAFTIVFACLTIPYLTKIIFAFLILTSSLASYATLRYGVIFDYSMMENVFETHSSEASAYLSWNSALYFVVCGLLPTGVLLSVKLTRSRQWKYHIMQRVAIVLGAMGVIAVIFATSYKDYASVGRNNAYLNKMIVPSHVYYSLKYIDRTYFTKPLAFEPLGLDATLGRGNNGKPQLLVLVLGETARAMNLDLNGYARATTPHTDEFALISFKDVASCGTATAHSVPCMFSHQTRASYNKRFAAAQDNVLDIIQRAGVHVVWRENDGGDKGIAKRVTKIDITAEDFPDLCRAGVCLDEAVVRNFDKQVHTVAGRDQLMVLHIMGSHGPTYWKRYPSAMARFQPSCERADIENCSDEQIVNTYDNTIAYTDYILSLLITQLQTYRSQYNVALMYISDHGESLGENGLYLHGTPYALAPKEQTSVPWLLWLDEEYANAYNLDVPCIESQTEKPWSHDNLFHTLLDFSNVNTEVKMRELSVFGECRR